MSLIRTVSSIDAVLSSKVRTWASRTSVLDGGERGGHRRERAGAVLQTHREAHLVAALGPRLPLDGDPALRVVDEVRDVGAGERVDRDALAARDVADDRLAQDRVAALGAVHQQVVGALHLDPVVAAQQSLHRVDHGERLRRRRRGLRQLLGRQQPRQHLAHRDLAVADRGEQVVDARPAAVAPAPAPRAAHGSASTFLSERS